MSRSLASAAASSRILDIQTLVNEFSTYAQKFQFEKALELVDAQRRSIQPDHRSSQWLPLYNTLTQVNSAYKTNVHCSQCFLQLAMAETHYFSLSFFTSKFTFRKENHLRDVYTNLR